MPLLGALGTIVLDRIHPPPPAAEPADGPLGPLEDWGGLLYSLETLAAALETDWSCLPLAKVGEDVYEDAVRRVRTLAGMKDLAGLRRVPEPNNRVELHYHDRSDRCERLKGGVPGWSWDELAPFVARCDALYINFIAGWEIELPAARALRRAFDGPIYCDVHSLLLGVDTSGVRVRRPLPDRDEWTACFDWIQGNEAEIATVSGRDDPIEGVRTLVGRGATAAFCTLGAGGAVWATAEGSGRVDAIAAAELVPGADDPSPIDPTGSGDAWGAACAAALVAGRPVPEAARRANRFGAATAAHRGTAGLAEALRRRVPTGESVA